MYARLCSEASNCWTGRRRSSLVGIKWARRRRRTACDATVALSFYINSYIFITHGHRARQPNGGRRTTLEHKYERNAAPPTTAHARTRHVPSRDDHVTRIAATGGRHEERQAGHSLITGQTNSTGRAWATTQRPSDGTTEPSHRRSDVCPTAARSLKPRWRNLLFDYANSSHPPISIHPS